MSEFGINQPVLRSHEVLNPGSLDEGQCARHEIRKNKAIYGRDFISPGGLQYARKLVAALQLQPGALVLDAGCGMFNACRPQ